MTFDDDFIRVLFSGGHRDVRCDDIGVDWPPPEILEIAGFHIRRERFSSLTDAQREGMTHVCRGAEYVLLGGQDDVVQTH